MKEMQTSPEEIQALKAKIAALEKQILWYEEQIRLAKYRQYGRKSEQTTEYEQFGLFDEAEFEGKPELPEPKLEEITYQRKKRKGKRRMDLAQLPVETREYSLEDQSCPVCAESLSVMRKEIRKELLIIPAQIKVREHIQPIYTCRNCQRHGDKVPVLKACAPEPLIKGSIASASAVAHIVNQKYGQAVPLYRQEQEFQRQNIALSRQTMANWLLRCSEDYFAPLYARMKEQLLAGDILHADETPVQVLREPDKPATSKSYMWLYRSSGDRKKPVVLYEYQASRSRKHPQDFLQNFQGYVHADGYTAYRQIDSVTVVGCWVHLRRKLLDSVKALPPEEQEKASALEGLAYLNQMFKLEKDYRELSSTERYAQRLKHSQPLAEAFLTWAKSQAALPQSALGKALRYALEQWPYLNHVFLDGRLELSNNRAERSIKPFVIGRKNWLFCNTPKGAKASAMIYSLMETAKENNLNPFAYFEYVLTEIPHTPMSKLDQLLPCSEDLPAACKVFSS